ncbi:hypothetical protein T484DRAFT_1792991 [Baffinella frigidus]|nr:hypothetical protein T484DRAFT_1792991 [Cryptophyta sp. CCMP2293]
MSAPEKANVPVVAAPAPPGYAIPAPLGVPGAPIQVIGPGTAVPSVSVPGVAVGVQRPVAASGGGAGSRLGPVSYMLAGGKGAVKMEGTMDMSALIPWGSGPLLPPSAERLMNFTNAEDRRPALVIGLPRAGNTTPFVRAKAVRGGRLYFTAEEVVDGLVIHAFPGEEGSDLSVRRACSSLPSSVFGGWCTVPRWMDLDSAGE